MAVEITKEKGDSMEKQLFYPEGWENIAKPITPFELNEAYQTRKGYEWYRYKMRFKLQFICGFRR